MEPEDGPPSIRREAERPVPRRAAGNAVRPRHVIAVAAVLLLLGVSYWLANSGRRHPKPHEVSLASVPGAASSKIEVINASGTSGLAARAADALRARGFDVVDYGSDRSRTAEKTIVIDRSGNSGIARQVADALGLPGDRVEQRLDRKLLLDVSVMLGKDAQTLSIIRTTTGRGTD